MAKSLHKQPLPCSYCGHNECKCEPPPNGKTLLKTLRNDVRQAYFHGCKYDRMTTAEHTKFLLDIIDKQDRREDYRKSPGFRREGDK